MSFSDDMKELAVELTDEFADNLMCTIHYGDKSYSSESGLVTVSSNPDDSVEVPRCMYGVSKAYFKKEDFLKASAILAVSGHYFNYEDVVKIGSSVQFADGSTMKICAKAFDATNILFEFGLM